MFKRYEKYIVINKRKLDTYQLANILEDIEGNGIETVECVVIESDWKCYEDAWKLVEEEYKNDMGRRSS